METSTVSLQMNAIKIIRADSNNWVAAQTTMVTTGDIKDNIKKKISRQKSKKLDT